MGALPEIQASTNSAASSKIRTYASEILQTRSKRQTPRAVTAIYDKSTGKTYFGESQKAKLESLDPRLKNALPKESLEKWSPENCAEVDAFDKALKDGARTENLEMHTMRIDKKTGAISDYDRCLNCKVTTSEIPTVTSDVKNKE